MISGSSPREPAGLTCRAVRAAPAFCCCAEALHPAVVGDADLLHDLAGLDLADAGQRLEQRDDLELADGGVVGRQRFGERQRADLQPGLDLGAGSAGLGGLRQCGGALLGCQLRRCCHAVTIARTPHLVDHRGVASATARHDGRDRSARPAADAVRCRPRDELARAPAPAARGSANVAVPTCTADAPASISSAASHPLATPPTPTIGRSGSAACTSCTARTATGWIGRPGQPAAAGAERRPPGRRVVGHPEQRVDAASPPRRRRRRTAPATSTMRSVLGLSLAQRGRPHAGRRGDHLGRQLGVVGEDRAAGPRGSGTTG